MKILSGQKFEQVWKGDFKRLCESGPGFRELVACDHLSSVHLGGQIDLGFIAANDGSRFTRLDQS